MTDVSDVSDEEFVLKLDAPVDENRNPDGTGSNANGEDNGLNSNSDMESTNTSSRITASNIISGEGHKQIKGDSEFIISASELVKQRVSDACHELGQSLPNRKNMDEGDEDCTPAKRTRTRNMENSQTIVKNETETFSDDADQDMKEDPSMELELDAVSSVPDDASVVSGSTISTRSSRSSTTKPDGESTQRVSTPLSSAGTQASTSSKKRGGKPRKGGKRITSAKKKKAPAKSIKVEEEPAEEEYVVEKIVDKKFENGVPFWFIKWKDWDSVYNTWEPKENLIGCTKLLEAFEANYEKRGTKPRKRKHSSNEKNENGESSDNESYDAYENLKQTAEKFLECDVKYSWPEDYHPTEVITVTRMNGYLAYAVKYTTSKEKDSHKENESCCVVRADGFRTLYPQLLLKFYDKRIYMFEPGEYDKITSDRLGEKAAEALFESRKLKATTKEGDDSSEDEIEKPVVPASNANKDKYGLPLDYDVDHSSDSSLSEDEYIENHTIGKNAN